MFFWQNKNDFGGCVPVPPADGCTYQQDIKASEKIMSFFVSIFFSFEQLFEIFWKTSGAWHPRSSAAIRTQRRWWLDLRSDGPKHCRHVFEDCCGWCYFRTWRFSSELLAQPLLASCWANASCHSSFWIRLDSDFDAFCMKNPLTSNLLQRLRQHSAFTFG